MVTCLGGCVKILLVAEGDGVGAPDTVLLLQGEMMSERIFRALVRAGRAFNNPFAMDGRYVIPRRGEAQKDLSRIVTDMRKVGNDLRKVSNKELAK